MAASKVTVKVKEENSRPIIRNKITMAPPPPVRVKEEKSRPTVNKEQEFIRIGIQFHDFQRSSSANPVTPIELKYRTPMDEPLHRIILDFCNRLDLIYTVVRFYYKGARIGETDTPRRFRMCEDDIVDALTYMTGCRCGCNDGSDSFV